MERCTFAGAQCLDYPLHRRLIVIVGNWGWPPRDRLTILRFEHLGAVNGGPMLQDAKTSVIALINLVNAEKAAQRFAMCFVGRIEPDQSEGESDREGRFWRVAPQ